ncbi:MAG TPA: TAT-variant-translocated molybdopterin oxidoreductase [Steroidobacteraceae bacterium]|nr:TAT-variant-translocated molybdopterin oxidoreductase [Steroidobacteraceae bacterium]
MDLTTVRRRLAARRGTSYWRSLEELADTPEFREHSQHEFPALADAYGQAYDRRRFLQLVAASMALAGLAACGPEERERDREAYVEQPAGLIAGRASYYATATALQGYGSGVLVQHRMGRPIKIEGNPDHPASLGATSAIGQATLLGLYDPFRAQALTHQGQIATWSELSSTVLEHRQTLLAQRGRGLALLTGTVTSPTLVAQISQLRTQFPELQWHQWEAVNRDQVRAGAELAFGRTVDLRPDFAAADVIVAIESDFLDSAPGHLRFARDFAQRRRAVEMGARMSRLYALESTPTLAGAKADHRLAMSPADIAAALHYLAGALDAAPTDGSPRAHPHAKALDVMASELRRAQDRALLHVGPTQDAAVHALTHAINEAIGAFGNTLATIEPVAVEAQDQTRSLSELTEAMRRGQIQSLIVLDGANPVYTAPVDFDFERALRSVPFSLYLGEYADETAAAVHWHVPGAHEYEAWSDVRAFDGTATIQQPQLLTHAERRSAHELLALLAGNTSPDGQTIVREYWRAHWQATGSGAFETFWNEALRVGVVANTAARPLSVSVRSDLAGRLPLPSSGGPRTNERTPLSVLWRPDPFLWDGRFADNGWLQELGRPFTRITWDNAALLAPRTAERLGLASGDVLEVALEGRRLQAPAWVLPGQAEECVTLALGYGRRRSGPVGQDVGFDAYRLRTGGAPWHAPGAAVRKLPSRHEFASIQHEVRTGPRDVVREGTLAEFLRNPRFLQAQQPPESLYSEQRYQGVAWAMSINLNSCIGCSACVAACQAENNSPVVGKTEVARGREMHWLRIDRYYTGSLDEPAVVFQPVPCMHCENAPCEVVCPVHATVHDAQGLNVMVYNRCVGTRFCSNNCPYKVRRFNFFDYTAPDPRPRESWNPEVTVRGRGVMEKCTYCIQRTRAALIDADRENRRIRDGEVLTACQQACPTQAITFGDRNDATGAVAHRKASPLDYVMLEDLNTRPRTSYEALIRNPHPELGDV